MGNDGIIQPIKQKSLLLNRPMTDDGFPSGGMNLNANASLNSPVDYFVEALEGEILLVARAIINIVAATDIDAREYADISGGLTNGLQVFYRLNNVDLNITNGLPIKINEDWGRWCFDSRPVNIGPTNKTPVWQARWTLTKYGSPHGITLFEGDRLGIRLRDDLSSITEQTIVLEGVHLGIPNSAWTYLL